MRSILCSLLLAVACSKPAPHSSAPAEASNAAALDRLREQRDAPPENHASTVAGDELERMEAFSSVKPPSTPGNPSHHSVCVTLYDKSGRPVASEGDFKVTSELEVGGGQYVYAPMFGPLDAFGTPSPLGACPSGGELWPNRLEQLRGKSFSIHVTFTSVSGKVLTADTSQSF